MGTTANWFRHFEHNRDTLLDIPWDAGPELTAAERADLGGSLAEFQRGESSEGRHLIAYADRHARQSGDVAYGAAIRLFVAEEQRHARELARFLELNGVPLARRTWTDSVFRCLRNLVGTLEASIGVLVLAEIIAQVYYQAMQDATRSRVLVCLCEQILRDEAAHVRFQAEQLGRLRASRSRCLYAATVGAQRVLFAGTCGVVWAVHRRALRRGGFGLVRFWRGAWEHFEAAFRISRMARDAARSGATSETVSGGGAPAGRKADAPPPLAGRRSTDARSVAAGPGPGRGRFPGWATGRRGAEGARATHPAPARLPEPAS